MGSWTNRTLDWGRLCVSADADNTHGRGLAYFSELDLRGSPPPPAAAPAAAAPAERPAQGQ